MGENQAWMYVYGSPDTESGPRELGRDLQNRLHNDTGQAGGCIYARYGCGFLRAVSRGARGGGTKQPGPCTRVTRRPAACTLNKAHVGMAPSTRSIAAYPQH